MEPITVPVSIIPPIQVTFAVQPETQVPAILSGPPGPSNYDLAVRNGYQGTELEWITQATGGVASHRFNQPSPDSFWTVTHNMGYRPGGILVLDTAGSVWYGVIEHLSENTLTIDFGNSVFSGEVFLS